MNYWPKMEPMPELTAKIESGRVGTVRRGDYVIDPAVALSQLEERVVNGRFRLLSWLGGTKTSAVYLTAFDGNPPRMAALKLITASAPDAEIRLAGWKSAAQLSHKNLMGIIDCGRCEIDRKWFVYEVTDYADEILAEILPARPLTPDETREMLGTALNALGYMHAHGYVHGRLKPSNILVVKDRLKLSADSIALASASTWERAKTNDYEAPEFGRGAVTPAVDVWALGMTLVSALTQRPAQWDRGYQDEPIIPAGIVEPFKQIIWSCLQVDPANRCTVDEIKAILDPGSAPAVASGRPEESNTHEARRPVGIFKTALIAAAAVVAVAGAALIVRTTEFSSKGTKTADRQTAASDSVRTPVPPTSKAFSIPAQTPLSTIEKPSPSGHATVAAPATKPSAEPAPVSSGGESNGVLLRVNPEVQPTAQKSIRGLVDVRVRVKVDSAGNVTDAELESQSGSNYFNHVAVNAARQWKFATGAGGAWQVQFQFRHDGTDLRAVRE
jgi:TonB family protein